MTNGSNYEKTFALKIIWQSHHTYCQFNTTSDKIYMTNKSALCNIPLIDSNTQQYAMVVLSHEYAIVVFTCLCLYMAQERSLIGQSLCTAIYWSSKGLASNDAVFEMGVLIRALKRLLMESK
jgi:hypothetical protein